MQNSYNLPTTHGKFESTKQNGRDLWRTRFDSSIDCIENPSLAPGLWLCNQEQLVSDLVSHDPVPHW